MHLTYPTGDGYTGGVEPDGSAGAPVHEIEVTPEMIEAGKRVLAYFGDNLSFRDLGPGDAEWFVKKMAKAIISSKSHDSASSVNEG